MIDRVYVRRLSDALSLEIPTDDLDGLAVELTAQLDRIRSLDGRIRSLDGTDRRNLAPGASFAPGAFFDVRWER